MVGAPEHVDRRAEGEAMSTPRARRQACLGRSGGHAWSAVAGVPGWRRRQ